MMYLWLLVGFVLLIKGADFFVDGSSSVAKILRVPSIIIGLTIVAFGTSAPELAVSVSAAISGSNDIAVGNVIGSNIFNLLMVVGICGVIMPMAIDRKILHGDFLFSIVVAVVMGLLFAFDHHLSRVDGMILLLLFAYFLYKMVRDTLKGRADMEEEEAVETLPPVRSLIYILGGLTAIVIGGDMVVDSASQIAASFGLSETLIGLTVVAFGTSLPELVTSVVASGKGENGLALGNVIGSNIFNILFVLALSATIHPMKVDVLSTYDAVFLVVSSVITWFLAKSREEISRREGIIMVLMYVAYTAYIIMR